jgi:hypothetical protein
MKTFVKATLLGGMMLAGAAMCSAQVSVAVQIGHPPPPARVVHVLPPRPAAEFMWVEGYWYPVSGRYVWHDGYWTRPPYAGARWVAPRYDGRVFAQGYWAGERGRVEHDHRWDHEHERDFRVEQREHERVEERERERENPGRGRGRGHDRD